jgi:mannose-6-phosphate isomerase-like protein (cupin superfamily)
MFLVWRGRFRVEFRDRVVDLGPGELVVIPRGVEHRTAADFRLIPSECIQAA